MITDAKPHLQDSIEDARLQEVLEYGKKFTRKYEGDWTAYWLLSGIREIKWPIRTSESRLVDGEWKGTVTFNWDFALPDGSRFSEKSHDRMRFLSQDMTFLIREKETFNIDSTISHRHWFLRTKTIIQWMYLNADVCQPDANCFSRIDTASITDFMNHLKVGGKAWALRLPQKTLLWMYRGAMNAEPDWNTLAPDFKVPQAHRRAIVDWLKSSGGYSESNQHWTGRRLRSVNRMMLAKQLSVDFEILRSSYKYTAFLRQFEPDLLATNRKLLIPVRGIRVTELPSHTLPLIDEVFVEPYHPRAVRGFLQTWLDICRLHMEYPERIPESSSISQDRLAKFNVADSDIHTPWVPLPIALRYTREALRWVSQYEEPLIKFYITAVETFKKRKWFSYEPDSASYSAELAKLRDEWVRSNVPPELKKLNITSWTSWSSRNDKNIFRNLRERPSVNDAMELLTGAVILLTTTLKPLRESEFRRLSRKCIRYARGDGFWLKHELRKAGVNLWVPEIERPIPKIVAHAIDGLGRLGRRLLKYSKSKDNYAQEKLLFLPQFVRDASLKLRLLGTKDINRCLDRFCDYVGVEPDKYGRRWYIRIHEMRKSFLITLFWCFRFSSLGAASWMAGHASVEELYDYITANCPGEELPHLYADYAAQQLWAFTQGRETELENVAALYRDVCNHFGVRELNLIPADELAEWLTDAFTDGAYEIQPYTIGMKGGHSSVAIAFKISSRSLNG